MSWIVELDEHDHCHVLPINDEKDHYYSQSCPCNPKLECITVRREDLVLTFKMNYIHNAWDGRE